VRTMCKVLGVSASGFYAWRDRPPSQRAVANVVLTEQIRQAHAGSDGIYGMPRIRAELRDLGIRAGRERIGRLMRLAGIQGVTQRGFVVTTERDHRQRPAPDLVNRKFVAAGPNQLWSRTRPTCPPGRASSIWQSCSTSGAGAWSAGRLASR